MFDTRIVMGWLARLGGVAVVWFATANPGFGQITGVRINELMANNESYPNADGTITDWVEFHNTTTSLINLSDASFTDSNAYPRRFVFAPGTVIPPKGFLVITCDSSRTNSATNASLGLGANGGYVFLYDKPASGGGLVDWVQYGLQPVDYSLGRVPDGDVNWQLCGPSRGRTNAPVPLSPAGGLKINEWMADDSGGGDDWFELCNTNVNPVALGGLYLTDTNSAPTQSRIPNLSFIGTGYSKRFQKFVADGKNPATNAYLANHVNFSLKASGEQLGLYGTNGSTVIHLVRFTAQANGVSEGWLPDCNTNNRVRFPVVLDVSYASPGEPNTLPHPSLQVNEVLAHTDPPLEDAVEFYNRSATNIDISGWWISNQRLNPFRARLPENTIVPAGGYKVIYEYQFNTNAISYPAGYPKSNILDSMTFNSAHGDEIHLFAVDPTDGDLTGYRVSEVFESSANGVSFGRYYPRSPVVLGDYKFVAMSATSFGQDNPLSVTQFRAGTGLTNPYPRVGPVVLSEVMYYYDNTYFTGTGYSDSPMDEYVELRNITTLPVPMFDPDYPTNHWRLQNAVNYTFTNRVYLAANSYCLMVGFDPSTNAANLTAFRTKFNVPGNIPIYGPWEGKSGGVARLNNTGDPIEIYRPDPVQLPPHPDAGYVPYIRIDKVNYSSDLPWPSAAGVHKSLQKINPRLFGNDASSWEAAAPTAGRPRASAFPDNDEDGMDDNWETFYGLNPNNPADAFYDLDGDGMINLDEFVAGTNPADPGSKLTLTIDFPNTNSVLHLRWQGVSNVSYSVVYRKNLSQGSSWNALTNIPALPATQPMDVTDPAAPSSADRYYQLVTPQVGQ
jgi:hypothetical protein